MSERENTTNKSKKKSSGTSSGTVHPSSAGRSTRTRSAEGKNPIKEKQEKNSPQGEITEDEDENDEDGIENNKKKVEEIGQAEDPTKTSCKNISSPSSPPPPQQPSAPKNSLFTPTLCIIGFFVLVASFLYMLSNSNPGSSPSDEDWRSQIDSNGHLPDNKRIMVFASLKPILDKRSTDQDEGVSTLLILSSDEEIAAELARCLLQKVNKRMNKNQISTEIDLRSHQGGKLTLDSKLRTLLNTTDTIRAVLLRRIGDIPSNDALDQLRLLFAYCDGENPVIPHRLIIMTATSDSKNENELRENFKTRFPNEHDFVDALMSRISGHTLYLEKDQKSIC